MYGPRISKKNGTHHKCIATYYPGSEAYINDVWMNLIDDGSRHEKEAS